MSNAQTAVLVSDVADTATTAPLQEVKTAAGLSTAKQALLRQAIAKATASAAEANAAANSKQTSLRQAVTETVKKYYEQVDVNNAQGVYEMVLAEVEEPLLEATMTFTRGNQSRAAIVLGLSRGTLRKLLKKYDLD